MTQTPAQARAAAKYKAENRRQFVLAFYPAHKDLWDHLQAQPKKAEYLRGLIRADMVRNGAKFPQE